MDLTKLHLHWRVSKYKEKSYRSYSLAQAYRKDGKNCKEIVVKLGKLSEQEVQKWRTLLSALKKPEAFLTTLDDIVVTNHYAYLDVAVTNAIWDEWKIDEAFANHKKPFLNVAMLARILTLNRCIEPISKSQISTWFQKTALPWLLEINLNEVRSCRVFRALDEREAHSDMSAPVQASETEFRRINELRVL